MQLERNTLKNFFVFKQSNVHFCLGKLVLWYRNKNKVLRSTREVGLFCPQISKTVSPFLVVMGFVFAVWLLSVVWGCSFSTSLKKHTL